MDRGDRSEIKLHPQEYSPTTVQVELCGAEGRKLNVDRLNPDRQQLPALELVAGGEAGGAKRVLLNCLADLQCELLVSLAADKLQPDLEALKWQEWQQWE